MFLWQRRFEKLGNFKNAEDKDKLITNLYDEFIDKAYPEINEVEKFTLACKYYEALNIYFWDYSKDFEYVTESIGIDVKKYPNFNINLLNKDDLKILMVCMGIREELRKKQLSSSSI